MRNLRASIAVMILAAVTGCAAKDSAVKSDGTPELRAQVASILEHSDQILYPHGNPTACVVRIFGVEPDTANVRKVYAWALCGEVMRDGELAQQASLPVAVVLDPPSIEMPRDGADNDTDKRRIFPPSLREQAFGSPYHDGSLETALAARAAEVRRSSP